MVGTGKYRDDETMVRALEASAAEIVAVVGGRVNLDRRDRDGVLQRLDPERYFLLANTAGCYTADDAVRYARLAREAGFNEFIKLEVIGDQETLLPDVQGLLAAAQTLVRDGFKGLAYTSDDLVTALRLEAAGCAAGLPLASPTGSGPGLVNPSGLPAIKRRGRGPAAGGGGWGGRGRRGWGAGRATPAPGLRVVLRLGAYQLWVLTRVPPYAAVSTSVELAREAAGEGGAGYVNRVLRTLARSGDGTVPGSGATHPRWLVARWRRQFGPAGAARLVAWNDARPALTVQPARWEASELRARLQAIGCEVREAPFGAGLQLVTPVGRRAPRAAMLPGFAAGGFTVQDAAPALLCRYAAIPPGARVYDACAAPGGKAALLEAVGAPGGGGASARPAARPWRPPCSHRRGISARGRSATGGTAPTRPGCCGCADANPPPPRPADALEAARLRAHPARRALGPGAARRARRGVSHGLSAAVPGPPLRRPSARAAPARAAAGASVGCGAAGPARRAGRPDR